MRFIYILPYLFCLSWASYEQSLLELLKEDIETLATFKEKHLQQTSVANLNEYLDLLLPKINQAILDGGRDPTSLPDQSLKILTGKATLTEGVLTQLSTMERYENATVTYDGNAKKVYVEFILRWPDLELQYKFHSKVLFISSTGHVTANLEHSKIHIKLGFDFTSNQVFVDSVDFKHTGDISLKFSGNKAIDWLTNAMSSVFTTIFHNLILSEIKSVAMDPIQGIVDSVNASIDQFLNP